VSALEGDRDAVMKTLGDTIRALDAVDRWRILAAALNAIEKDDLSVWIAQDGIFSDRHAVRWVSTAAQWRYTDLT
jgi:hypothetical protein